MLRLYTTDLSFFEGYLEKLADEASRGFLPAAKRVAAHAPRFAGVDPGDVPAHAPCVDDARQVCAREHGFDDWTAFAAFVLQVADGARAEPYVDFIHACEAGDMGAIVRCLDANPDLVRHVASTRKSPLHSAGSAVAAQLLIERGAPVDLETPLPGGTALIHALIWGRVHTAEAIAAHRLAPGNLRVAAGLGRIDLLRDLVAADGTLAPAAAAGREYYRPNDGWYAWQPTPDPQEILDEALLYAATNGRIDAAATLVERGAHVDGLAYETRPLIRAAWRDQRDMVAWLLEHGADVNATGWLGGHCQGTTALHMAAQADHRELAGLLLERGADPSRRDALYDAPPDGWAGHHGHPELSAWLRAHREGRASSDSKRNGAPS